MVKTLDKQDLYDILYGCTILGTGGGGEMEEGLDFIDEALKLGKEFKLVDVDDVPDDALVCTPYMLGAISPLPEEEKKVYNRLPRIEQQPIMLAFDRLKKYLGSEFYGTISCEMGGSNTALSFYVAAMSGGLIIDADTAGRAVPEITHSTYYLNGLPASPIFLANVFGETMILENLIDDERAEQVARSLSMASRNDIAVIDHALEIKTVRNAVIKGAISYAHKLGKEFRKAKQDKKDVARKIADIGNGFVAFRGKVENFSWKTGEGFTIGDLLIQGTQNYSGNTYKIDYKNENMISWLNNEVHATIPDLICLIDTDNNEPVTNPNHKKGMNVAVIILPAAKEFVSEKGLKIFGPKYLGYDFDFRPAEQKF